MKLIKKEALNIMVWNNENVDIDWGESTLYKSINDTEAGSAVY